MDRTHLLGVFSANRCTARKMAIGAFSEGFGGFWNALTRPEALHALMMTGLVVIVVTLLNTLFGIMMALYLVGRTG